MTTSVTVGRALRYAGAPRAASYTTCWGTIVKISLDGRGRWIDNRMIETLWRLLNRRSAGNMNAST